MPNNTISLMVETTSKVEMRTIAEWASIDVFRVRSPNWVRDDDYILVTLTEGQPRWGYLFSEAQSLIGEPTPQAVRVLNDKALYERYKGVPHTLEKAWISRPIR